MITLDIRAYAVRLACAAMLLGCVGSVNGDRNAADAGPGPTAADARQLADAALPADANGNVDAAPVTGLVLAGTVRDYFTRAAIQNSTLDTIGIPARLTTTTDAAGAFSLAGVPVGSGFYVRIASAAAYRNTINLPTVFADQNLASDLYQVSRADTARQYATAGIAEVSSRSLVIADLRAADDSPLEGLATTDISLLDMAGTPVGDGPYFVGPFGDLDPAMTTSAATGGTARVVYLNVPVGLHTLTAVVGADTHSVLLDSIASGANLVRVGGSIAAPHPKGILAFAANIYALLQSGGNGGSGCTNCHKTGGTAATLRFDGGATAAYQALMNLPGAIDLTVPTASTVLTAPLYETPADHPNATWLDTTAEGYQTVLAWLLQGALP